MLPRDTEARLQESKADAEKQTTLDSHLAEQETVVPYSDAVFREAALEWLIATDQVCIILIFLTLCVA